jgi:hypothetical protein
MATATLNRGARAGGCLVALGFVGLVLAGAATWTSAVGQAIFAAGRAEVPHSIALEGDGGEYALLLLANPLPQTPYVGNAEAYLRCDVARPDGTSLVVDGSRQAVGSETDVGVEIGRFVTTPGTTRVTCHFQDNRASSGYYYSAAATSPWYRRLLLATFASSTLALVLGAALLVAAYRKRAG